MRKIYVFILAALLNMLPAKAQTITSFIVSPASPTITDTVTIYIQCDFSGAGCAGQSFFQGVNGNEINGGGLHCLGVATMPCTDFDTITVPPLTAGNYTFIFLLSTGITAGCIPGIIPLDIDSTHFTISTSTISNELDNNSRLLIVPNPSTGNFIVKQNAGESSVLKIYSMQGSLIKSIMLKDAETDIITSLQAGVYTIMLQNENKKLFSKLVIVTK